MRSFVATSPARAIPCAPAGWALDFQPGDTSTTPLCTNTSRLLAQVSDGDTALDKAEFWEHGKCEELLKQAVTAA